MTEFKLQTYSNLGITELVTGPNDTDIIDIPFNPKDTYIDEQRFEFETSDPIELRKLLNVEVDIAYTNWHEIHKTDKLPF